MFRKLPLLLTFCIAGGTAFAGSILTSDSSGELYFFGVACSHPRFQKTINDSAGISVKFQTAADLKNWKRLLLDEAQMLPGQIMLLEDPTSLSQLTDSFQLLLRRMGPNDKLVFHFSGASFTFYNSSATDAETRFYLQRRNETDISEYFNLLWLRNLLDVVPARQQAVILDAGETRDLRKELIDKLTETNALKALLENRERVIICNYGLGVENPEGGLLTRSILHVARTYAQTGNNRLKESIRLKAGIHDFFRGLFSKKPEGRFSLPARVQKVMDSLWTGMELNWIRESDITEVLASNLQKREKNSPHRGETISLQMGSSLKAKPDTNAIRKYALIVGINDYKHLTLLNNPVDDAKALAEILKEKYNYQVFLLLNCTSDQFMQTMLYLRDSVSFGPNDQLLLYMAGHGTYNDFLRTGGIAFTETKPVSTNPNMDGYIKHGTLLNMLQYMNVRNVLVILDVCYGGTLAIGTQTDQSLSACREAANVTWIAKRLKNSSDAKEVAESLNCANRIFITSGGMEYVPDGTPGAHSPFTAGLLSYLDKEDGNNITATDLASVIRKNLKKFDRDHQTTTPVPAFGRFGSSSLQSDFVIYR